MSDGQLTTVRPIGALQQAFGAFSPAVLMEQVQMIQQAMATVMHDKEHYGTIPGCGDKPTLFKAGAEKLCFMFRLAPEYRVEIIDMGGGHREYRVSCRLSSIQSGSFVGEGVGSCSTMESKYRYRNDKGSDEITDVPVPKDYWDQKKANNMKALGGILASAMGEQGRYGTRKNDDGVWVITRRGESSGKVENPDIADVYNTCLKMAKKRASVDACLTATAASDIFAQDLEDLHVEPEPPQAPRQQLQPQQPPRQQNGRSPAEQAAATGVASPEPAKEETYGEKMLKGLMTKDRKLQKEFDADAGGLLKFIAVMGRELNWTEQLDHWTQDRQAKVKEWVGKYEFDLKTAVDAKHAQEVA